MRATPGSRNSATVGPDPDDGRAKRVKLTARGRSLVASLLSHSEIAEKELAKRLGKARLTTLRETLGAAVASFASDGAERS